MRQLDVAPKLFMGLVLAAGLTLVAWAQETPARRPHVNVDEAPVSTQSRGTLSACSERAFRRAWAETDDSGDLKRFTTVLTNDDNGTSATLSLAEYGNGNVGVYLGSRDKPSKDQWIVLQKEVLSVVKERVQR